MEELNEDNSLTCTKCNQLKHVSEFGLRPYGFSKQCKACISAYQRNRKQRLMDEVLQALRGNKDKP
jgi:hypothetical protein